MSKAPAQVTVGLAERRAIADRIAAAHGCEITPGINGQTAIAVSPRYQQGNPIDARTVAACRAEIERAGIDTSRWVS